MNPLESWKEEQRAVYLYRVCADAELGTSRGELFTQLAGEAEAQAAIWRAQLTARGAAAPSPYVADARTRLVARLVEWFGPRRMRPLLAAMKVRGMSIYATGTPLPDEGHGIALPLGRIERRHRGLAGGGNLRAAVFGLSDGLVSNAGLIFGVAGAGASEPVIVLSGVAGLAAGAFAMAAGEYVSVQSQRELFEYQIALERDELAQYPEAEAQELALIYTAKGLPRRQAEQVARKIVADPAHALDTLAREELGLNPDELGSPFAAALTSWISFALGALLPLLPYLVHVRNAIAVSIACAAVGLFAVGAVLSLFTGRRAWRAGSRLLVLGACAGGLTFLIGRLLGVGLG
ncbi:MAG: VIT1/CCC1 transporter family protein [Casimicrobiaceae bacterium]